MSHYLINKQLQNTDKKHIKKMKKYLHISENSVTHTHTHTQLADKGLNNDLYNYKGGVFPIGGNTASFCSHLYKCRQSASGKKSVKKYWIKPVKKLSLFELALGMVLGELGKV